MKPLHVGLLVVGAAIAGGLAMKMTQPQAFQPVAVNPTPAMPAAPEPRAVSVVSAAPPVVSAAPPAVYLATPQEETVKPAKKMRLRTPAPHQFHAVAPPPAKAAVVRYPVQVAMVASPSVPISAPLPYQPTPEPAPLPAPAPAPAMETVRAPDSPPPTMPLNPVPMQVTLAQGTQISVRLDQTIASDHMSPGDTFQASLAEPLIADGYIVAERGARVTGRVVDSQKAGRLSGSSSLQLSLSTVQTADGQKIAVSTEHWVKQGDSSANQNVARIGGGAALGAIIGAIAGGGKGAAIGAGAGGAVGTGAAAATRGRPVTLAIETVIRFRLALRVQITERPL